jgi:hypothetical protein
MNYIKLLSILLATLIIAHSHIYTSTPTLTYGISGTPTTYHLYISLEYGLGPTDYIHFIWPEVIHAANTKSSVQVNLISFSNNLVVSSTYVTNDLISNSDSNYYVTFGYQMQPNTWYEIQVFPTKNPTIPSSKLLQVVTLSSISSDAIIYDANYAFAYIDV